MFDWLQHFLALRGYAPHGYCLFWDPALLWTHVVSDSLIALAYFSIPFFLIRLLRLRKDIEFGWMILLFAVFILACGATHIFNIITMWVPAYGWEAVIKAITALASVGTASLLIPLLPRLVAIPSPTALHEANEALQREARERERTEEMLRQSQKMEVIGQLTGGVAHDFNNLLGIVIGNLDRVARKGSDTPEGQKALVRAVAGAERAARLTEQLLAFARRQPLHTTAQDINEIVSEIVSLIEETIGSAATVVTELSPDLPRILVDRNQIENAILNLAVNAHDAMPDGGQLVISTHETGENFVAIAIRDTGCGMDAATLAQATDPFFTTKPVGKGSGLGLSQVVGTVEQLGGRVEIASDIGVGTTVTLFLPVKV